MRWVAVAYVFLIGSDLLTFYIFIYFFFFYFYLRAVATLGLLARNRCTIAEIIITLWNNIIISLHYYVGRYHKKKRINEEV